MGRRGNNHSPKLAVSKAIKEVPEVVALVCGSGRLEADKPLSFVGQKGSFVSAWWLAWFDSGA